MTEVTPKSILILSSGREIVSLDQAGGIMSTKESILKIKENTAKNKTKYIQITELISLPGKAGGVINKIFSTYIEPEHIIGVKDLVPAKEEEKGAETKTNTILKE